MFAGLFDGGQIGQNTEHPDRAVLDDDGLSGRPEAELRHLLVGVGLLPADLVDSVRIQHVLNDKCRKVRAVHHIGFHVVIALQELHFALIHIGLEDLGDVIKIAGRTVDHVLDPAL